MLLLIIIIAMEMAAQFTHNSDESVYQIIAVYFEADIPLIVSYLSSINSVI